MAPVGLMRFTKTVSLPLLLLLLLHCLSLAAAARAGSSTVYLLGEGEVPLLSLAGCVLAEGCLELQRDTQTARTGLRYLCKAVVVPAGGLTQAALVGLVNRREGRAAVAAQLLPTDSLWHSSLAHDRPDLAYVNTTLGQLASYAVKTGAASLPALPQ